MWRMLKLETNKPKKPINKGYHTNKKHMNMPEVD